jgi:hypothetical protein
MLNKSGFIDIGFTDGYNINGFRRLNDNEAVISDDIPGTRNSNIDKTSFFVHFSILSLPPVQGPVDQMANASTQPGCDILTW